MTERPVIDTDDPETSADAGRRSDADILSEARKRYQACKDAEGDNRRKAIEDLNFLVGGENQWDSVALQARKADNRPIITVNSLPTYLHQVTNDQRMNTPAIKVHAVDDKADPETANVRQGLIRHIEYDSNADVAYDTAVNSAAAVGFGYFRLVTDYEAESSFNQKIMFQRIRNAMSVKLGPHVEPDGSDSRFAFVELKMSKDEFKRDYPEADAGASTVFNEDSAYADWLTDTEVLVCDYYCIETEAAEVVRLTNGESGFKDDLLELPPGVTIDKTRMGMRSKTMLYKITGVDILERTEIKCKWIPVFPVYGDEIDIEGKIIRSGIIRNAKGPAQMYNVMMTSATEEVLSRSKSPYIMAEGQDEGWEDEWDSANVRALSVLHYKPVALGDKLAPPPQRNQMADVPTGFLALSMHASDNVKKTTGLFDASLGARGTATSGKQELAQQREGDVANFHYMDGLMRTIRHCARCINNMIPHYYDAERTVRILGEDDSASYVTINEQKGAEKALDMSVGEYDVTVTSGPSFSTMRQENAEFFANALSSAKDPASAAVFSYLAIQNQDVPGGETATKMMKTLLPPQAKAVLDEENSEGDEEVIQTPHGPVPVAQVPQILQNLEMKIQQCEEALQKVDASKTQTELLKQQTEHLKQQQVMKESESLPAKLEAERIKAQADLANAETARIQAQADMLRAQAEAQMAPHTARAQALSAETERMNAEVSLLTTQQQAQVAAAEAEAKALNGNETALEVWKASLEAQTKIAVAEIAARSVQQRSKSQDKQT